MFADCNHLGVKTILARSQEFSTFDGSLNPQDLSTVTTVVLTMMY